MVAQWLAHILASGARLSSSIPAEGEVSFWCRNMLSLVSFAGMTLNKCAVLWIGTVTRGPVQGESPPLQVKEPYSSFTWFILQNGCIQYNTIHLLIILEREGVAVWINKKKKTSKLVLFHLITSLFLDGYYSLACLNTDQ